MHFKSNNMYLEAKSSFKCFYQLDRSTREIELGLEYGSPVMNIGGQSLKFEEASGFQVGLLL